jgi:hypothetical protein
VVNVCRAWLEAGAALGVVVSPGLALQSLAEASATPDSCIEVDDGDWDACNVGNSGRGDLPYLPVQAPAHSVARCIQVNQGDAPACSIGSIGGYYPR